MVATHGLFSLRRAVRDSAVASSLWFVGDTFSQWIADKNVHSHAKDAVAKLDSAEHAVVLGDLSSDQRDAYMGPLRVPGAFGNASDSDFAGPCDEWRDVIDDAVPDLHTVSLVGAEDEAEVSLREACDAQAEGIALQPRGAHLAGHSFWRDSWDRHRTGKMMLYGLLLTGPVCSVWYPFIARFAARTFPTSRKFAIGLQMAMDQLLFEPPMLALFFAFNAWEPSRPWAATFRHKMDDNFVTTYMADMAYWPGVMGCTFAFVSPTRQTMVVQVANLFWTVFLSTIGAED